MGTPWSLHSLVFAQGCSPNYGVCTDRNSEIEVCRHVEIVKMIWKKGFPTHFKECSLYSKKCIVPHAISLVKVKGSFHYYGFNSLADKEMFYYKLLLFLNYLQLEPYIIH